MHLFKNRFYHSKFILLFACCFTGLKAFSQTYTVPVVFHIISNGPSTITDQDIADAVLDLNNAFAHTGPYAAGAAGVNTRIRFCLARVDPDGAISSGITRTQSSLSKFDQDIEDDKLKKLVSWKPDEYCNIWLVDSVKNEYYNSFSCGIWNRKFNKPYASYLPGDNYLDGIVTNDFGSTLAMLMGNYLGLLNSFVYGSCANTNCNTEGDGVCDTPPASAPGSNCTNIQNSCSSDTLSGFTTDVPDLVSNFMSFSGDCTNSFTEGQAVKMRNTLNGARNNLLNQNKCNPPCAENITAGFTRDNWLPAAGELVHFLATSAGGVNFQWSVNGVAAGTNSNAFNYSFPQKGKYKVQLKVYNANNNCFAGYSDSVIVGCGVMARFTPNKRLIASKDQILTDSIYFTNLSVSATDYQWWISNNAGLAPQVISTAVHLNQVFHEPGKYAVWLVASKGGCSDTTEKFNFTVNDPTADGSVNFRDVQCYEQTKLIVTMSVCNSGYVAIPAGTPVSFYDGDPYSGTAKKLGPAFLLSSPVAGNCCVAFTTILDIGKPGLNQLYAVFNDNGSTNPVVLPNNPLPEIHYHNNIGMLKDFQFRASILPSADTLEPGDILQLQGIGSPGIVSTYAWSPAPELSCTDCANPVFTAGKNDVTEKLVLTSSYGCVDSATIEIKVPYADDYRIQIDTVECAEKDSVLLRFTVCNSFTLGIVPNGLNITFYDGDPALGTAEILAPVFSVETNTPEKCISFTRSLKASGSGSYYGVVNDSSIQAPVVLPVGSAFPENDYSNNISGFLYQAGGIILQPSDTSLFIGQSFQPTILSTVYDPASTVWNPGEGYVLSCRDCFSPVITVSSNARVTMNTANEYGCLLEGQVHVKILQPDFTTEILETHCYTNDSLQVKFNVCVNNGYANVFAGIPVSFYDGNLSAGTGQLLGPGFVTSDMTSGNCAPFTTTIKAPLSGYLSIVVNDFEKNISNLPDTVYRETDYSNNSSTKPVLPFSVSVTPTDTTVNRLATVPVHFEVSGGALGSFNWNPAEFISCINCQDPVITPPHTMQYELEVKNEFACTAKAVIQINTLAGGKVSIPNAFTPNGDGRNDVFYIMGSQDIKIIKEFTIFNRWGWVVFSETNVPPNDPGFGWNGLNKGTLSSADGYVYIAVIEFKDGSKQVYKGSVVLIL